MNWLELKPDQRLVAATAIQKVVNQAVKTGVEGNVRDVADRYVMGMLPDGGNTAVRINGRKVATYSVIAKEVGEGEVDTYVIDSHAFGDWLRDDDAAANAAVEWILADTRRRDAFLKHLVEVTGVVPDGVEAFPKTPHLELKTRLTQVKPEAVAEALGDSLPSAIAGLLGGE